MDSGIYCIEHIESGKKYIGKSKHIKQRFAGHKWALKLKEYPKDTNRYLWRAAQKHGIEAFKFWVVEILPRDDKILSERELYWMDFYDSCNRDHGYNLRRDSSGGMEVHPETRALQAERMKGSGNPNFGNYWSEDMKARMSEISKRRHAEGAYSKPETKVRRVAASKAAQERMRADPEKYNGMVQKVKEKAQARNKFLQYTREGDFIKEWDTKEQILNDNPGYKWQNVYAACNGSKPTYMNFIWRMVPKATTDYPLKVELQDGHLTDEYRIKKSIQASKAGIPTIEEAIGRIKNKGRMDLHDRVVDAYILKYDPENYDNWCEWMSSEWEKDNWERLYGEDGLGLDPERGLIKD